MRLTLVLGIFVLATRPDIAIRKNIVNISLRVQNEIQPYRLRLMNLLRECGNINDLDLLLSLPVFLSLNGEGVIVEVMAASVAAEQQEIQEVSAEQPILFKRRFSIPEMSCCYLRSIRALMEKC